MSKRVAVGLLLSGCVWVSTGTMADESASAPAAGSTIVPVKTGDRITLQRTPYVQLETRGEITLSKTPGKPFVANVDSDSAEGRTLRYGKVFLTYDVGHALVAWTNAEGVRKDFDPETVLHWMPQAELKPGMKWDIAFEYKVKDDLGGTCSLGERYKAHSEAVSRDILINKKPMHIDAIEVTLEGRIRSVSACQMPQGELEVVKKYVYSKELNLVLESSTLKHNDFSTMIGGSQNYFEVVKAISTL